MANSRGVGHREVCEGAVKAGVEQGVQRSEGRQVDRGRLLALRRVVVEPHAKVECLAGGQRYVDSVALDGGDISWAASKYKGR